MNQERFNSVVILNHHKSRTDKINIVDIANSFACNDNRQRHFGKFTQKDLM